MILIVEQAALSQILHEQLLKCVIRRVSSYEPVPIENPPGIGIDHEKRLSSCIEQNRIGSFLSDAVYVEQFLPQDRRIVGEHFSQAPRISVLNELCQILQTPRFYVKIPARPYVQSKPPS